MKYNVRQIKFRMFAELTDENIAERLRDIKVAQSSISTIHAIRGYQGWTKDFPYWLIIVHFKYPTTYEYDEEKCSKYFRCLASEFTRNVPTVPSLTTVVDTIFPDARLVESHPIKMKMLQKEKKEQD